MHFAMYLARDFLPASQKSLGTTAKALIFKMWYGFCIERIRMFWGTAPGGNAMPIYEYECPQCGDRFELFREISNSDQDGKCPKCGAENAHRIFSSFAATSGSSCAPGNTT
jgi:putative FmdB family regulatory protein